MTTDAIASPNTGRSTEAAAAPLDDGPGSGLSVRVGVSAGLCAAVAAAAHWGIADPKLSRAAVVAGVCLVLWLSEAVPLYATTLLLWVGIVLLLGPVDPRAFGLPRVLGGAASPVMALFFGGFALSVAGAKYGVDAYIAGWMVRAAGGRRRALLLAVMAGTAVLSMWMSNIAAAAMMVATLRPLLADGREAPPFRRALLLGVAFAANFGGIGTPVGTGPNLVAIGAVASRHPITFLEWMRFGVPVAAVMLGLAFALLTALHGVSGRLAASPPVRQRLSGRGWAVVAVFCATVTVWLLEPVLGVPAAVGALGAAGALWGARLLDTADLRRVQWDTLLLIAGGLTLGQLFDDSGLAQATAAAVRWDALPPTGLALLMVAACAGISAVASNTAAAAILIQVGMGIAPSAQTAVLVALGASMGVPFVISTPPNAMVYGEGHLRPRDLLVPGLILTAVGCVGVAVAGPHLLRWAGVP
jgi:sodium-dependent dicarboxylate transporter 2/3/5